MTVRRLYVLAGVLWALVLAPMVFFAIVAMGAVVSWLYLFGDDPWPEAAEQSLLVLGCVGALAVASGAVWLGHQRGKKALSNERQRVVALSVAPLVLASLVGAALWLRARDYEAAMTMVAAREAAFADFVGANKKLVALTLDQSQDMVSGTARISGARPGAYRLSWRIIPSSSRLSIIDSDRSLSLGAADEDIAVAFALDELQRRYQDVVLSGRGGALIEEPFRLEVVLDPVLTEKEIAGLPPGERSRLRTPDSPLQSRRGAEFPVRFLIPG